MLVPIPFLTITNSHNTCIHKQMSYVFGCLEMIWFPHNHFVEICRIQADSKLQISQLVFALNKHEAVYHRVASWTGFRIPAFNILSISCLKASFKWTGIGFDKGSAWLWHLDLIECGIGDLRSIQYYQIHQGSIAEFALYLSPAWELLVVNQTL